MAAPLSQACVCHVLVEEIGKITAFTPQSWQKYVDCSKEWILLDGKEQEIAEKFQDIIKNDVPKPEWGYHRNCYKRYCDVSKIKRSKKRLSTVTESQSLASSGSDMKEDKEPPRKSRRLLEKPDGERRSENVLPRQCLICKKEKWIKDKNSGKRIRERLANCEYESGGILRKAAELLQHEAILVDIRDKDMVAIEVRYHRSCYKEYTKILYSSDNISGITSESRAIYQSFCKKYIEEGIISGGEVMRLTKLQSILLAMLKDTSSAFSRTSYLKEKLLRDYPQLKCFQPSRQNVGGIIYCEGKEAVIFEQWESATSTSSVDSDVELESGHAGMIDVTTEGSSEHHGQHASSGPSHVETREVYNASLIVRKAIKDMKPLDCKWPPTAADMSMESVRNCVPVELFNFLAWSVGLAEDDPTLANFVSVDDAAEVKLLSLCQDIVYLASRGRRQTPKSFALGMTVHHLTRSNRLLSILNKFGHCVSHSTVVGLETNLAELRLLGNPGCIPQGFQRCVPTIMIWDNIDFGEETLSGKGTTHHTNGIMVQASVSELQESNERPVIKKGSRKLTKPVQEIEEYFLRKKQGPSHIPKDTHIHLSGISDVLNEAKMLESAFGICKVAPHLSCIPGWSAFHIQLNKENTLDKSAIHYLPVIEQPPTEMATIKEILNRSSDMCNRLDLKTMILVFDQAIYSKVQQIRWTDPVLQEQFVVRLGEFHTCMAFLAVIGKRFGDGGLKDVLLESRVVAEGSIAPVLNGHHYNRSLRVHKLLAEALIRLQFQSYLDSLDDTAKHTTLTFLSSMADTFPNPEFVTACGSEAFKSLLSGFSSFTEGMRAVNPTYDFWCSYIEMVQLLLLFIRGTRESNWNLHLAAFHEMLPWVFAYDRQNYARYGAAYLLEMVSLPVTHPEVHDTITSVGQWTVQRSGNGFTSIACDQAIEQTVNRDSKTSGGLIGITRNRGAVQRWILSQNERAAIVNQCENMVNTEADNTSETKIGKAKMMTDEQAIQDIISVVQSMQNPFDTGLSDLICISSGVIASASSLSDIKNAKSIGNAAFKEFMEKRLIDQTEDYFAPLKAKKLKSFSAPVKAKTSKQKEISLRNDKRFMARMLIIAQTKSLDMRMVLSYSLSSVSMPLASTDGSLAKTNKADLLQALESSVSDCLEVDVPQGALMVDCMAILQSMPHNFDTFGLFADAVLKRVVGLAHRFHSHRVDVVSDTYPEISIKNYERSRRGAGSGQDIRILSKDQKLPAQWKKFLANGKNKENLVEFLFEYWSGSAGCVLSDIILYITHGSSCHRLKTADGIVSVEEVVELSSDHEEADTRLLLHACHSGKDFSSVIIHSPDTDVAVIALGLGKELPCQLFFSTGVKNKARVINLSKIISSQGKVINALIGLHTYTGCDSTSAFKGKGKKRALDLVSQSDEFIDMFAELGTDFVPTDSLIKALEKFACSLYRQAKLSDINEARYMSFCLTSSLEHTLPPTRDAHKQHVRRASYQAAIHKRSLQASIEAPSPDGHGWDVKDGEIHIHWMSQNAAPDSILEIVNCKCSKSKCSSARCSCCKSGLSCTDLCACKDCSNRKETIQEQQMERVETEEDEEPEP